jgi:DNA polymerase I
VVSYTNVEDTLLGTHSFASHLPKSLAHVVSVYADTAPWKHVYKSGKSEKGVLPVDMPATDLQRYGAADARLNALVWPRMQEDIARERKVYEHDKLLARLCASMTIAGINVDRTRAEELDALMRRRQGALKGLMRNIVGRPDFQPTRLDDVRRALFKTLRARWSMPTSTGLPSTSDAALESLQGDETRAGRFAEALLKWRAVTKIRATYLRSVELDPLDLRAHFGWKPFGTVSGRLACRIQSCPRWSPKLPEERIREIYIASKGCKLVAFDVSQIEMRFAAYLSGDPDFVRACSGDVHAENAKRVFRQAAEKGWLDGDAKKDPLRGKPYRDIAKNLGFAIGYGAEADKLFITVRRAGLPLTYAQAVVLIANLRNAYRTYFRWVDENIARVKKEGYMRSPLLGRIRWLGWYPKPTDVMNYPIQSAAADIVNRRSIDLLPLAVALGAPMVLQVHDACYFDCPVSNVSRLEKLLREQWAEAIDLPGGKMVLPIDLHVADRWSEL